MAFLREEDCMTEEDLDEIATKLIAKIQEQKHDFWIDPEKHYQEHQAWGSLHRDDLSDLRGLLNAYRTATSLFWKAFIGFAIVGAGVLTVIGITGKHHG